MAIAASLVTVPIALDWVWGFPSLTGLPEIAIAALTVTVPIDLNKVYWGSPSLTVLPEIAIEGLTVTVPNPSSGPLRERVGTRS